MSKPEVEPMQPLVSIYDKALDLKIGVSELSGTLHAKLGNVSLREYLCNYLIDSFYGTKEDFEEVTDAVYPVFVTLVKAGYIEGSVTTEGYLREFDFDKAMEFVSRMIAYAFGCSFNGG